MDLLRLIRSIEELIYELTSWLVFYPLTMFRAIVHPLRTMHYVADEEGQDEDEQFTDTLSPPLLLFVTILLTHGLELGTGGLVRPTTGALARIFASEQLLLLFRAMVFSLFPLFGAVALVTLKKQTLTRATLRTPFFALCCVAAPFALAIALASLAGRYWGAFEGATIAVSATIAYIAIKTAWLRHQIPSGWTLAAALSTLSFVLALSYILGLALALS